MLKPEHPQKHVADLGREPEVEDAGRFERFEQRLPLRTGEELVFVLDRLAAGGDSIGFDSNCSEISVKAGFTACRAEAASRFRCTGS